MADARETRSWRGTPQADTVRQTIVETIEAPRLTGVSTANFVAFRKKREIYEWRVAEKNSDSNIKMQLTSYKDSIDLPILQLFTVGKWVPVETVEEVTEDHLRDCVRTRSTVSPEDYNISQIRDELKDVKLERSDAKTTLETQVWNLCLKYNTLLQDLGYEGFTDKHPKLAVKHILKRVTHPHLKNRMLMLCETKKKEEFQENYNAFIRQLGAEAQKIDYLNAAKRFAPTAMSLEDDPGFEDMRKSDGSGRASRKKRGKGRGTLPQGTAKPVADDAAPQPSKEGAKPPAGRKRSRELPDCLNPACSEKHFIDDCAITTPEQRRAFKKAYWDAKKAKRGDKQKKEQGGTSAGHAGHVGQADVAGNSSLFSASFCDGALDTLVLADQGSDANIISPSVLDGIVAADPSIAVTTLTEQSTFSNANPSCTPVRCDREIQASVLLRVRHGTNLMLRGLKWLVSVDEMDYVYIGRHVLSAIGINNEVLLAAAVDRFAGHVDVPAALEKDGHDDAPVASRTRLEVNSILAERGLDYGTTFHSHGGPEDDGLQDSQVYVDLGEDNEDELTAALEKLVLDASKNGLSDNGADRLSAMLRKHRSVFAFGWEKPRQPTYHK